MKYKELLVGDWYKYGDNYYIFTKQLNGENINVNLTTGAVCAPLKENTEIEFCSSLKISNPNIFVGLLNEAPYGVILKDIVEGEYFIKPYTAFTETIDTVVVSAFKTGGYWFASKCHRCNVGTVNEATLYYKEAEQK